MKKCKYDEYREWPLDIGGKTVKFQQAMTEISSSLGITYDAAINLAEGITKLTGHHISESVRFLYAQREVMRNQ